MGSIFHHKMVKRVNTNYDMNIIKLNLNLLTLCYFRVIFTDLVKNYHLLKKTNSNCLIWKPVRKNHRYTCSSGNTLNTCLNYWYLQLQHHDNADSWLPWLALTTLQHYHRCLVFTFQFTNMSMHHRTITIVFDVSPQLSLLCHNFQQLSVSSPPPPLPPSYFHFKHGCHTAITSISILTLILKLFQMELEFLCLIKMM